MKKLGFLNNPFVFFLPFLFFFIFYILRFHTQFSEGDEGGYIAFAKNLTMGFYSPPAPDINLWWGPGYPLFLAPFIALKIPLIWITITNAIFQYLSIVMLFKSLFKFFKFKIAIIYSLFWAFCFSSYVYIYHIIPEALAVFLLTILLFFSVKGFNEKKKRYIYLTGIILGYIALTKVLFAYIIILLLFGSVVLWIIDRESINYQKSLIIALIALFTISPYLIYTYTLTDRLFYVGNSGGENLYWMTTPVEKEFGDWQNELLIPNTPDTDSIVSKKLLSLSHKKDLIEIKKYKGVKKDDAFKMIAIKNIRNQPVKYVNNIISNLSRALFGFPYSYSYQRPVKKIWYFSILYSLTLFSLILTLIEWRRIPFIILFIFFFTFLYLGLSLLVYMSNRQLVVIIPLLLFWIAFIVQNTISIKKIEMTT
jgi:hypothetical protein